MPCRVDDLAQHLLRPERMERGRVVQVRVTELCDSVRVRVEECRRPPACRLRPTLRCRGGCACGRRSRRAPATGPFLRRRGPPESAASARAAGSTGLPSKSVTTKPSRLRNTCPTCRSPCPSMTGVPASVPSPSRMVSISSRRARATATLAESGRVQTVSSASNAVPRHRAASCRRGNGNGAGQRGVQLGDQGADVGGRVDRRFTGDGRGRRR